MCLARVIPSLKKIQVETHWVYSNDSEVPGLILLKTHRMGFEGFYSNHCLVLFSSLSI